MEIFGIVMRFLFAIGITAAVPPALYRVFLSVKEEGWVEDIMDWDFPPIFMGLTLCALLCVLLLLLLLILGFVAMFWIVAVRNVL